MKTPFVRLAATASLFLLMAFSFRADQNIVETARAAGQFNTLLKVAEKAGILETLTGAGPYTVFAPTDEAFAKVPKARLDDLMNNPDRLKQVLLFHVIPGKVTAEEVTKGEKFKTLQGKELKIRSKDGKVTVDRANIIKADVQASNGIIHVVDEVLVPSLI